MLTEIDRARLFKEAFDLCDRAIELLLKARIKHEQYVASKLIKAA